MVICPCLDWTRSAPLRLSYFQKDFIGRGRTILLCSRDLGSLSFPPGATVRPSTPELALGKCNSLNRLGREQHLLFKESFPQKVGSVLEETH